ncbi:MAG: VWA domain-containing protein [Bacteroidia bacterium]
MARKEINLFSASFLDLLSGALGAVIILYILVPKLTIPVEEFEEQKKLSEEVGKLGVAIEDIADLIPQEQLDAIKSQMEEVISAKNALEKKIAGLQQGLEECLKSNEENVKKILALESELEKTKKALDAANSEIENLRPYKEWMDKCNFTPEDECPEVASLNVDVGFKFKGKNLLFIIDASGSMDSEGRMGQVQAGIKMLITTMGSDFNCDVMWFGEPEPANYFGAQFSSLQAMNDVNKKETFKFINNLKPGGGTPTGIVLEHALTHGGYSNLTDIILLSDGIPSVPENVTTNEILSMVSRLNQNVAISTIGVGKHMIDPDPSDLEQLEARNFLEQLAQQNNGFFYGF